MSAQEDVDRMIRKVDGMLGMDKEPTPEGLIFRSKEELDRYIDERVGVALDNLAKRMREQRGLRPSPRAEGNE